MDVHLIRTREGLIPSSPQDYEAIEKVHIGATVRAKITQPRNILFHRKFFAMLNFAFDCWEPELPEYNGLPSQKNFERFRKDVTIAAGYYDIVVNLKGEARAEAHSISFGKMDDIEFEKLYGAVATVIIQRVLRNYTREDLDRVVDELIRFTQ